MDILREFDELTDKAIDEYNTKECNDIFEKMIKRLQELMD